jgi:Alanine-zipper, major outer membrane lipoprotein
MHRFSSRLVSSSFLAIAMSILVVGVVWASSGALQTSNNSSTVSSSTVPGGNEDDELGDGDLPGIGPGDEIDELRRLVVDLADQVETLTETISTMQSDISNAETVAREAATAAGKVKSIADDAAADAEEAQRVANDVASRFGSIELRTSKLNDEGVYSGAINPNQLSRRLSPTDMTGDWPLNRVTGELETKHLLAPFSGNCTSRYGFYSVLVSDPFRRITCERIASQ